ncbi:MAG: class I tRNA ligase family protein, partial [Micromonosporaceae bacterium]|nr:class I tRNA ligase family protein [Micromonosporaceae bacterium]
VARFQRMRGKAVFYPMGWDDNGLPTERRVQSVYGVRCDPALAYNPSFAAPQRRFDPPRPVSRRNFIELCTRLTEADEVTFERLWRRLGLSVDWSYTYTTIGPAARSVAQRAFLRNLSRDEAYLAQAPTLWDTGLRTAVAQAEVVDKEQPGAYHRLRFRGPDDTPVEIETTRPELLPACVALVAHPSDTRYAGLVGQTVHSPLFNMDIKVYAHPLADPAKGTGLAMVCTFGDLADVAWWRDLALPSRVVVGRDGRLLPEPPAAVPADRYAPLAGRTVKQARRIIVEMLRDSGELIGEARAITHMVKFYEKGDAPLEIVASRQWYLRNGGGDARLRERLLELGRSLHWVPEHMRHRYEPLDLGLLAALSTVVDHATAALERYDHTAALVATEEFFWNFCDDYIELVKQRAYGSGTAAASARAALTLALSVQLRLFAPFLPFVTEEVWSWPGWSWPGALRDTDSVHRAAWPAAAQLPTGGEPAVLATAGAALRQARRFKSDRRLSMKTELPVVEIGAPAAELARLRGVEADLRAAAHIGELRLVEAADLSTSVLTGA